jgi:predicted metal-dependent peptidase
VFSDGVQARNIAELAGVLEQARPKRLTLIWCDASIKQEGSVIELDEASDLRDLKPVGGGGTNYFPVLEWIKNNSKGEGVDLGIFFTDGEVQFASTPHPFPTIWASSSPPGKINYPFGQVVHINNIARSK